MTARRRDVPSTIRREVANREEGSRQDGGATLPTLRSPMVRGRAARRSMLLAALVREGLIDDSVAGRQSSEHTSDD